MSLFDDSWVRGVTAECDPIFEAAEVGFTRQVMRNDPEGTATALLWEAEPALFAAKYPDSGIIETYGTEQWPDVTCIDWWVYLHPDTKQARISVEGWNLPELWLPLSGHGEQDGCELADVFARFLGVPSPRID